MDIMFTPGEVQCLVWKCGAQVVFGVNSMVIIVSKLDRPKMWSPEDFNYTFKDIIHHWDLLLVKVSGSPESFWPINTRFWSRTCQTLSDQVKPAGQWTSEKSLLMGVTDWLISEGFIYYYWLCITMKDIFLV